MNEYPDTDSVPDEKPVYHYPFFARLFGIDIAARQIADAITSGDTEALQEALETLRSADVTVDNIEPGTST